MFNINYARYATRTTFSNGCESPGSFHLTDIVPFLVCGTAVQSRVVISQGVLSPH